MISSIKFKYGPIYKLLSDGINDIKRNENQNIASKQPVSTEQLVALTVHTKQHKLNVQKQSE